MLSIHTFLLCLPRRGLIQANVQALEDLEAMEQVKYRSYWQAKLEYAKSNLRKLDMVNTEPIAGIV